MFSLAAAGPRERLIVPVEGLLRLRAGAPPRGLQGLQGAVRAQPARGTFVGGAFGGPFGGPGSLDGRYHAGEGSRAEAAAQPVEEEACLAVLCWALLVARRHHRYCRTKIRS